MSGLRPGAASHSQGNPGAVVFEFAGQHAAVQLVKVHQLDQIREARVALVETEEHLTFILHLRGVGWGGQRDSVQSVHADVEGHGWENSQVRSGSV